MNDTLRNNILFGNRYDPVFYQKTIEACCLQPDFDMLLGGDATEIGERGINLSGGQKARISLARAVYARADIYLFDDPLSAVDAHVGRTIFDKVVGPNGMLAKKTRVFVTHQIQYLAQSTNIMMMREGRIVEQGNFEVLMRKKSEVYQLVVDYGRDSSQQTEFPDAEVSEQDTILVEEMIDPNVVPADEPAVISTSPMSTRRGSLRSTPSIRTLRRPSVASIKSTKVAKADQTNNNLMTVEQMNQGSVHRSVYQAYAKACSYTAVLLYFLSMFLSQGASIATSLWLTNWSREYDSGKGYENTLYYIGVYAAFGFGYSFLTVLQNLIVQVFCGIRSARVLHQKMLVRVLRSPMMFFDTTP